MTDREMLIEMMREADELPFVTYEQQADYLIANGVTVQSQWISCEERLPETIACCAGTAYSEAVIVFTTGKKVLIAIFNGEDFLSEEIDYWDAEHDEVTHWMPLPDAPKGVE